MFFSKSALFVFALMGAVSANDKYGSFYDIGNGWQHASEGGDTVLVEPLGCGGQKTIKMRLAETSDSFSDIGDIWLQLKDVDPGDPDVYQELTGIQVSGNEVDGNHDIDLTFTCTPLEAGCRLDFVDAGGTITPLAGGALEEETSTPIRFVGIWWKNGIPDPGTDPYGSQISDLESLDLIIGCSGNPVIADDPHIKTWGGMWYDYMGECDLVFVDAPGFEVDMPMKIHARTKARYDYSYIESAVVMIGDETLEVGSWGEYFLNGVEGAALPNTISGFKVTKVVESEKLHRFFIEISDNEKIVFKVYKDWVSVGFEGLDHARYANANGLIGAHDLKGKLVGRDGKTVFDSDNTDEFAQEWQVQPDEPMLFHSVRAPQAPAHCIAPSATETQRRLGEQVARDDAIKACEQAGWSKGTVEMCIHDIMATGDLALAEVGAM